MKKSVLSPDTLVIKDTSIGLKHSFCRCILFLIYATVVYNFLSYKLLGCVIKQYETWLGILQCSSKVPNSIIMETQSEIDYLTVKCGNKKFSWSRMAFFTVWPVLVFYGFRGYARKMVWIHIAANDLENMVGMENEKHGELINYGTMDVDLEKGIGA